MENKTLLLIENNLKDKILEEINQENRLINIKIMTKSEFLKHYFFDEVYFFELRNICSWNCNDSNGQSL